MVDSNTTPEEEVQEGPQEAFKCERCGWVEKGEATPDEADKEEYLRCILGSKSFIKEYLLYDGQIKLQYRTCNNKEVDALNALLFTMIDHEDSQEIQDKSLKLKLLYFLSGLALADNVTEYAIPVIDKYDVIDSEFNKRFGDLSEPVIRMMTQTLFLFMELQQALITQGFDENFWQGAGLHSR